MGKLEDLKAQYRRTHERLSERQKAELERDIWAATGSARPRKSSLGDYMVSTLGGKISGYLFRQQLLNAGDLAAPLWEKVQGDHPWTLKAAVDRLVLAKHEAVTSKGAPAVIMQRLIEEYEALPFIVQSDGTVVHKRMNGPGTSSTPPAPPPPPPPPKSASAPQRPGLAAQMLRSSQASTASKARPAWNAVRESITALVGNALAAAPVAERDKLIASFDHDLRALFELYKGRIDRAKGKADGTIPPCTLREVQHACRALNMPSEPAHMGDKLSHKHAKLAYRTAVGKTHPDRNHSPDAARETQELTEAWALVEDYLSTYGDADASSSAK